MHYEAKAGDDTFALPFKYDEERDVTVYKYTDKLVQGRDYTFAASHTIKLSTPLDKDYRITIRRDTDIRERVVDFVNAAELTEHDLDKSASQVFYAMQEAADNSQDTISPDPTGNWNIHFKTIVNLAKGINPNDGVNKEQLDEKDDRWDALSLRCDKLMEDAKNIVMQAKAQKDLAIEAAGMAEQQCGYTVKNAELAKAEATIATTEAEKAAASSTECHDSLDKTRELMNQVAVMEGQVTDMRDEVNVRRHEVESYTNACRTFHEDIEKKADAQEAQLQADMKATIATMDKTSQAAVSKVEQQCDETVQHINKFMADATDKLTQVRNTATGVVKDKQQIKIWRDETEQFRDEASVAAGKATNYMVDMGDWMGAAKGELPPVPTTSARWRAVQGGDLPNVGTIHGGDFLYYSVKSGKFFIEGNVLTVNGRGGAVKLSAGDVGAMPDTGGALQGSLDVQGDLKHKGQIVQGADDAAKMYETKDEAAKQLATKADKAHTHTWGDIKDVPEEATRWPAVSEVTGFEGKIPANSRLLDNSLFLNGLCFPSDAGFYHQPNEDAARNPASHYPVPEPGILRVYVGRANQVVQEYTSLETGATYTRCKNGGLPWTGWSCQFSTANPPSPESIRAAPATHKHDFRDLITNVPAQATRWPNWNEVGGKPAQATRWPTWNEVGGKPAQATRWPSAAEVGCYTRGESDQRFAAKNHTHVRTDFTSPAPVVLYNNTAWDWGKPLAMNLSRPFTEFTRLAFLYSNGEFGVRLTAVHYIDVKLITSPAWKSLQLRPIEAGLLTRYDVVNDGLWYGQIDFKSPTQLVMSACRAAIVWSGIVGLYD